MERIDKIIASQGQYSRKEVKSLISKGRVTVDDKVVKSSSDKADPAVMQIAVDGKPLCFKKNLYLMLNKPKGYVSATEDREHPTVLDLVPPEYRGRNLFPAGRLDRDTTGLMIITDDGALAHNILAPKKHVPKLYRVEIDIPVTEEMRKGFAEGVNLNDGVCKSADLVKTGEKTAEVTLREGRYHQIKRMFGCFGAEVLELSRLGMGNLQLPEDLKEGRCRELTEEELRLLQGMMDPPSKHSNIKETVTELLAPAGNMEALKAAIANGCDAVYLGMQKFGARAYSCNFDNESLSEAVRYSHLREVKVYVTMNTIVFEDELEDMHRQLAFLNEIGVDGVIVQDIAVFAYIVDHFPDMEAHCSTQMGIDDLEGTVFWKEMGAKRVVLAREVEIERAVKIRKTADIPIEIFVHGALCVSYSGNCLMSGLIGYRSGNRGRCVGSCRKPYELIDLSKGKNLGKSYILSTKDLNTIQHIEELKALDSLKIEGRMKEPAYVANVVAKYRKAIDGRDAAEDRENLKKTFNRTFTKGYLFHEDPKDLTNIQKPNNFGYEIGVIGGAYKGMYEIRLQDVLCQNDIIRVDHNDEDVNLSVVKLYDKDGNLINKADKTCYIRIKEKLSKGDKVYKTKDYLYYKELEKHMEGEFRRFPLDLRVYAYPEAHMTIDAEGLGVNCSYESEEVLEAAQNRPTGKEEVTKQLAKLNDTVFTLRNLDFEEAGAFIPVKMLNRARRDIVNRLYDAKLNSKPHRVVDGGRDYHRQTELCRMAEKNSKAKTPQLTASVVTKEQYDACRRAGITEIYFENVVRRNQVTYSPKQGEVLIGGYGGLYYYKDRNPFVTDYSFNVVNSVACRKLHELGARRVTLSYELNRKQISDLITAYRANYGAAPSLEMIVYGRAPLLFTKYCPLKKMDLCGQCKKSRYELRDEYGNFPILSHADCTTTILNGKILNLLDEMPNINGIDAFRLNFTIEEPEDIFSIVKAAQSKLEGKEGKSLFCRETDTRGHFNREIL